MRCEYHRNTTQKYQRYFYLTMFLCVITTKTVYCICPLPAPVALVVCGAKASCKVILLMHHQECKNCISTCCNVDNQTLFCPFCQLFCLGDCPNISTHTTFVYWFFLVVDNFCSVVCHFHAKPKLEEHVRESYLELRFTMRLLARARSPI